MMMRFRFSTAVLGFAALCICGSATLAQAQGVADVKLSVNAPSQPVMVGHPVEFTFTVTNTALGVAGPGEIAVTLSEEASFSGTTTPQTLMIPVPEIAAGLSVTLGPVTATAVKQGNLLCQAAIVIPQTDPVPDDNKAAAVTRLYPGPDLTGEWVSVSQTCRSTRRGQSCSLSSSINVTNRGTVTANAFVTRIYVSDTPGVVAGQSGLVTTLRTPRLAPNQTRTFVVRKKLSESISGKYLVAVVDADEKIDEMSEQNNTVAYGAIPE